jgi:hypothetical protein
MDIGTDNAPLSLQRGLNGPYQALTNGRPSAVRLPQSGRCQRCAAFKRLYDRNAGKDEPALAVLALLACVAHRLERSDFVN